MREETILEMNQDEEIKSTNFFNDQLFLSINNNKSKNWSITCIHLNNNSATEIFACKSEIKWMLAARGRNLNESFYVENKMSLDVGDEDCLLIGIFLFLLKFNIMIHLIL